MKMAAAAEMAAKNCLLVAFFLLIRCLLTKAFKLIPLSSVPSSQYQHHEQLCLSATSQGPSFSFLADVADLPICSIIEEVSTALSTHPNLLLEAPPGAGKTTVVPLVLLNDKKEWSSQETKSENDLISRNIWVVEPRRVAARGAAQRMASMLNEQTGKTVGYAVRGDVRKSEKTRVTVVTDGVLLNHIREDPELTGIDAVVFDEFHERGVGSDTALALCREAQRQLRPDLRIVVMSATLLGGGDGGEGEDRGGGGGECCGGDGEDTAGGKLVRALGGAGACRVLRSAGRQYPIEVRWARSAAPLGALRRNPALLAGAMADAVREALAAAPAGGDVLAFLPGAREIRRAAAELAARAVAADVVPLYGRLPKREQDAALYPAAARGGGGGRGRRQRVILSSPIAEASLTLAGVTCVVDAGLRRESRLDRGTGLPRLATVRCSRASARQRAGRAGREGPGLCLRLYSEAEFEARFPEHAPPEVVGPAADLAPTALLLADWGCARPREMAGGLPWVDAPGEEALGRGLRLLVALGAMEEKGDGRYLLTPHGRAISRTAAHPRLAAALARAAAAGAPAALAAAAAAAFLLDEEEPEVAPAPPPAPAAAAADLAARVAALLAAGPAARSGRRLLRFAAARDATTACASYYYYTRFLLLL